MMGYLSRLLLTTSGLVLATTAGSSAALAQVADQVPVDRGSTGRSVAAGATDPATPATTDPAGVNPQADPSQTIADTSGEDIVVTGIRASLQSAQTIKRDSVAIVDALVAEDIGKFPDNNASEALARVTGVQVGRYRDEANGVLIRGLPNVQTTLQNRDIFTADGRAVALQDFPAQALSKVEVFKATTATNIEGGIAGLVNIGLRRPFDFKGFELAGAIRGTYNDESRKYDPIGSVLVSNRWDTGIGEIGALLNFSYTQSRYLNSIRYQGFQDYLLPDQQVLPASVGRQFTYPQDIGLFYARGIRKRPSLNGSLQWRPNDNLEVYVDGLWQAYRNKRGDDFFGIPLQAGSPTLRDLVLTADGKTPASFNAQLGIVNGPSKQVGVEKTDTYQGAVGAKYTAGNAVFTTDLAYTKSIVDNVYYSFDTQLIRPIAVDVGLNVEGSVDFTPTGLDFNDPASYNFRGFYDQRNRATGEQIQWQGNMVLDTGSELFPEFQIGLRYANRDASARSGDRYAAFPQLGIPIAQVPGVDEGGVIRAGFRGSDTQQFRRYYSISADGVLNNITGIRDFVRAGLVRSGADAGTIATWAPGVPDYNAVNAFSANEVTYAGYTQLKFAGEALGIKVDGVIGTRIVITDNTLDGTSAQNITTNGVPSTVFVPVQANNRYVDVLPNINLTFHLTDKLQFRATRTEALSRPGFNQINPALTIQQGTIGGIISYTGSGGNPNLQPIRSDNYDASLEYYFSRTGSVSVAGFYRKINGFISSFGTQEINPTFGPILVYRPQNAGSGQIKGIEAAFTTFFDFLPGFLSGFGIQANGTYIDGSQSLPPVPGLTRTTGSLPGVSKWSYNVIGLYEAGPASVRLAYNHRSANVDSYTAPGVFATAYSAPVGRLDLSASYDFTPNATITVDATNLLKQPYKSYVEAPAYPRDVRYEGRIFSIGARLRY